MANDGDTIAALATAPGSAAIAVVRVGGPGVPAIAEALTGQPPPPPRRASLRPVRDASGALLDEALVLYFRAPRSYTGEDLLELQIHGGQALSQLVLEAALAAGARAARPGEFTLRAFLNGRIDLTRAEAVADLIAAEDAASVRAAAQSLTGAFHAEVQSLADAVLAERALIEAELDFADDEIPQQPGEQRLGALSALRSRLEACRAQARRSSLRQRGLQVAICGPVNAGKSTLLNRLLGERRAIVSDVPGTTRDLIQETLVLGGALLRLTDTAGLRAATDAVEREGVARAREAIARADHLLVVTDAAAAAAVEALPRRDGASVTWVHNKIDLAGLAPAVERRDDGTHVYLSALTGAGVEALEAHLAALAGGRCGAADRWLARERHVAALDEAHAALADALRAQRRGEPAEVVAEALRACQQALGRITGETTDEDVLERIFSSFCIGK